VTEAEPLGHADTGRSEIFIAPCRRGGTLQYYLLPPISRVFNYEAQE